MTGLQFTCKVKVARCLTDRNRLIDMGASNPHLDMLPRFRIMAVMGIFSKSASHTSADFNSSVGTDSLTSPYFRINAAACFGSFVACKNT